MIAFEVRDMPEYEVITTLVENNFPFESQYDVYRSKEEAVLELKKRIKADIDYLYSLLDELS